MFVCQAYGDFVNELCISTRVSYWIFENEILTEFFSCFRLDQVEDILCYDCSFPPLLFPIVARPLTCSYSLILFSLFSWNALCLNVTSVTLRHTWLYSLPSIYGRPFTSCATDCTAFSSSIARTTFPLISALAFLLRTLLGPCARSTLI